MVWNMKKWQGKSLFGIMKSIGLLSTLVHCNKCRQMQTNRASDFRLDTSIRFYNAFADTCRYMHLLIHPEDPGYSLPSIQLSAFDLRWSVASEPHINTEKTGIFYFWTFSDKFRGRLTCSNFILGSMKIWCLLWLCIKNSGSLKHTSKLFVFAGSRREQVLVKLRLILLL